MPSGWGGCAGLGAGVVQAVGPTSAKTSQELVLERLRETVKCTERELAKAGLDPGCEGRGDAGERGLCL